MSELTNVEIQKENEQEVSVIIKSFRNDSMPNGRLTNFQDIATTGFVLFCNVLFQFDAPKKQLADLYAELNRLLNGSIFDKYYQPKTTNQFIGSAKVTYLRTSEDFYVNELTISSKQRQQLYDYMAFDENEFNPQDDFYVDILSKGDRGEALTEIIGQDAYEAVEPKICIALKFRQTGYITHLFDTECDTALDSHIGSWLPKEQP